MEKLPPPILGEIMSCLTPREVFVNFMPLNRACFVLVHDNSYVSDYLRVCFSWSKCPYLKDHAERILYLIASNPKSKSLKFLGFGTTGGIQSNSLIYWVDNLYYGKFVKAYPSRPGKFNINTVGVLSSTQEKALKLNEFRKLFKEQGNSTFYSRYYSSTIITDSWGRLRGKLERNNPDLEDLDRKQKSVEWICENMLKFQDLKRNEDDVYVLVEPIDYQAAHSGLAFFLANEIFFSRPMDYTCPVFTLMVFVSDVYVDIEDKEFARYNDLRTADDLEIFMCSDFGHTLKANDLTDHEGVLVRTFRPCEHDLKPVMWVKFYSDLEKVKVVLEDYFHGVYLYTKLIAPKHTLNEESNNIDAKRITLKGFEINLNT